ncbi:hypothetical protein Ct61P_15430 [Colletotrichum tofieldiae]|nr:hypothetical protein Ct61P_15430 [Colletotrichum tofieldiae]
MDAVLQVALTCKGLNHWLLRLKELWSAVHFSSSPSSASWSAYQSQHTATFFRNAYDVPSFLRAYRLGYFKDRQFSP